MTGGSMSTWDFLLNDIPGAAHLITRGKLDKMVEYQDTRDASNGTQGMADAATLRMAAGFRAAEKRYEANQLTLKMKAMGYKCTMTPANYVGPSYSTTPTVYEVHRPSDGSVIAEGRTACEAWEKAGCRI